MACHQFSIREIRSSTEHFNPKVLLGQGGFGRVYKGTITHNGTKTIVAIKKLESNSHQGENEFRTEIEMLSKIRHKNIVSLIGYCADRKEKILIYEYMSQGTLANHLHQHNNKSQYLSWESRLKASIDAARGLHYLHSKCRVVHRDVKSSNILLDENWVAKIADFGISKMGSENNEESFTHVSTAVKGTYGYLDPEYYLNSRLTRKSDVYAFGVVLLEVLCGRRAIEQKLEGEEINLASWASRCIEDGKVDRLVDENLIGKISPACLEMFIKIAGRCISPKSEGRPSMDEVVKDLELALDLQYDWDRNNAGIKDGGENGISFSRDAEEGHKQEEKSLIVDEEGNFQELENSKIDNILEDRSVIIIAAINVIILANVIVRRLKKLWEETILALVNIVFHKWWKIWEGRLKEEEIKISTRATRLCRRFSLAEIKSATRNFSDALVIGKGGFGKVYKGVISDGGETVAIKRQNPNSRQGIREFRREIETISDLQHVNIVSLIGYCKEKKEMILVYEYLENGSLADHLYKLSSTDSSPSWKKRLEICIGAGRGLDYLHTGRGVIHRDVKASNILLDDDFVPKLSDFGLAKPEKRSKSEEDTVSEKCKGTFGYFDPDYLKTFIPTRKSDVYAFGVVLLEVLCGRPGADKRLAIDPRDKYLTLWFKDKISKGEADEIAATSIKEEISPDGLRAFLEIAQSCLQDEPKKRPTMAQVVIQLESVVELQDEVKQSYDETVLSVRTGQGTRSSTETFVLRRKKQTSSTENFIPRRREQTSSRMMSTQTQSEKDWRRTRKLKRSLLRLRNTFSVWKH